MLKKKKRDDFLLIKIEFKNSLDKNYFQIEIFYDLNIAT